jgi:methionyl-tRNA formyltransferase
MYTEIGLDTGDMINKAEIEIPVDMTAGELHDKMSLLGAEILIKTLVDIENGTAGRTKQDESLVTYAPKVDRETGRIDWTKNTRPIHDLIRGTNPWPGAFSELCGLRARIWRSELVEAPEDTESSALPGTILKVDNRGMLVKTGDGALLISEIQMDSSKRMTPKQYACGHELKAGMSFNA